MLPRHPESEHGPHAAVQVCLMINVLVVHGPDVSLFGARDSGADGKLGALDAWLVKIGASCAANVRTFQSNAEGPLIDAIREASGWADGIIVNAGAYAHSSYGLTDAIASTGLSAIEVQLSNVYGREPFRHRSSVASVVAGVICGLGWRSYEAALIALVGMIKEQKEHAVAAS